MTLGVRPRPSVSDRVLQAPFVLLCAIDRVGAATIPIIAPGETTAVVRIDKVLRAPDVLGDLSGSEATVELADPAREGDRFVVFADGAMYGETIAVREIGRMDPEMSDDLAELLDRERDERPVRHLRERARAADVVVRGTVRELRPIARGKDRIPTSEHDPEWWIAVIAVLDVGKGRVSKQKRVDAVFANSQDVQWYESPKPQPGQDGVFLLHRVRRKDTPRGALVLVDPADLQPPEYFEDVRQMVGETD